MNEIYTEKDEQKITDWLDHHKFKKIPLQLLFTAFTHPSFKGIHPEIEDYERLEFLGDSVLDLIAAEQLIQETQTSKESEGILTERRKKIVSNDVLAQVFTRLKIEPLIYTAINYTPSTKDKANFVESFIGAMFLAEGYEFTKQLWEKIHRKMGKIPKKTYRAPMTEEDKKNKASLVEYYQSLGLAPKNAKSMLQELCQKQGLEIPVYEQVAKEGTDNEPIYTIKVSGVLFNRPPRWIYSTIGKGRSKKIAEMRAAEKLCKQIYLDFVPMQ